MHFKVNAILNVLKRGPYLQAGGMWWSYSGINRQCRGNAFPHCLPLQAEKGRGFQCWPSAPCLSVSDPDAIQHSSALTPILLECG
ncbi:hypothetical protein HHUSO_G5648 [Huso huso]|uniref:Uncharacterized protein n=1 Tax=Huso huso TaxID=61971 RepID=A0ABR1A1H7_HUSHU